MIHAYIIFRAVSYLAVGLIALNRRWYSIAFLMSTFLFSTLTTEVVSSFLLEEVLKLSFSAGVIWLGWDLVHSHKKP